MKKLLIILGVIMILLISALAVIPMLFKDDIRRQVEEGLAESVDAEVYFGDFGISFFRNFPGLTVYMTDFGITGRDEFEGLPLVAMDAMELEVNLFSLFGDQVKINGINLESPTVYVKVLEDGSANYDIAIASDDTVDVSDEPSSFSIGIDHWSISNGNIIYDDDLYKVFMKLVGMQHTGSGNFNQDEFDLNTLTKVDSTTFAYEGSEYLSDKSVDIDMILNISNNYSKFTFKENTAKINDFSFSFAGFLELLEDRYDMNIAYATEDNSFKSLLSILPQGVLKDIEDLKTKGNLAFNGFVEGSYSETMMPAFNLHLEVSDAMLQYPDLPSAVNDINLDLTIDHKEGDVYNTSLDLKELKLNMGGNPVQARIKIDDFIQYPVDAEVQAKLDLAQLNSIFPVEGLEMKGDFNLQARAQGKYDSIAKIIPEMDVRLGLKNGYVKSVDFPIPVEALNVDAKIENTTGLMKDLIIHVEDMNMVMDKDRLNAKATIRNMDNYSWDMQIRGGLDLENVMKIYPVEGMNLKGKIKADIETKGTMADLDAGRYEKLPTSGDLEINNLVYESPDLPQGFSIENAKMDFSPRAINIQTYKGTLGKSDLMIDGQLNNYMGYTLKENEILKGKMNLRSSQFDANEWMQEEEGEEIAEEVAEETELAVTPIPENIDFVLNSSISTLLYDNLTLKDMNGQVVIRNGILSMNGVKFNTLGGLFAMNGSYNTQDLEHPKYDFAIDIQELSIKQSYSTFTTVQAFAPVAQLINGDFSSDLKISGELNEDMSPNLGTINMDGLVKIAQAALGTDSEFVSGLTSNFSSLKGKADQVTLKDVVMKTSIKDGKLKVDPFKVKLGDYDAEVSGSYGLDQQMDYLMTVDVPTGQLGNQLNSALASLTGTENTVGDMVKLPINIGGTYKKPSFKVGAAQAAQSTTEQAKTAVEEKANEEIDKAKEEAKQKAQKETEELKEKAKEKLKKLFGG